MAGLSIVQLLILVCEEREAMVKGPPPMNESSTALLHGCPTFLHRHFTPQSPPSHPLDLSPQSTAALVLGLLHNP